MEGRKARHAGRRVLPAALAFLSVSVYNSLCVLSAFLREAAPPERRLGSPWDAGVKYVYLGTASIPSNRTPRNSCSRKITDHHEVVNWSSSKKKKPKMESTTSQSVVGPLSYCFTGAYLVLEGHRTTYVRMYCCRFLWMLFLRPYASCLVPPTLIYVAVSFGCCSLHVLSTSLGRSWATGPYFSLHDALFRLGYSSYLCWPSL